jgi:hypothetical protein
MKIRVPVSAVEAKITDREMLLVNLICQFLLSDIDKASEINVDTEYYFHEHDIKHITRHQHAHIQGPPFAKLREVLVFKSVLNDKVAVTLRSPKMNRRGVQNGTLTMQDYEITDQRAINLYFYLIGVTSVKGVIKEFSRLKDIPKNQKIEHSRLVKVHVY